MANRLSKLEAFQQEVDNGLSYVRGQQTELERLLDDLEKSIPSSSSSSNVVTSTTSTTLTGTIAANDERLRMYDDLQGIHQQVDSINSQISSLVEQVNDAATSHLSITTSTKKDDLPLSSILELLNSHLDSMQLLDTKIDTLTGL